MAEDALYQIVLLGPGCARHKDVFIAELTERLAEIGGDLEGALRVLGASEIPALRKTAPSVAVYFGGGGAPTDEAAVGELIGMAVPILPVVDAVEDYAAKVPPALHPINGMAVAWDDPDFAAAINIALENLSLLRRRRRLFLSYFRKDSSVAAHQLRVAFDDRGFDTFLDTSSVPKGDDFQSVLWHRLLDSDVMIVLDTADFLTSRWTRQELAQASAMSVGMLRVVWPGVERVREAELAAHLYLDPADFLGDRLTDAAAERIIQATEVLRARCIAARHTNLVVEFCEEAERIGVHTAVQPERFILAQRGGGQRVAAIPAVGVPDAQLYHDAAGRFPVAGERADAAVLIYDHRGMLPAWIQFLDWLDDHLPVKGLRVTETAAKLGGLL
ncbi:MAG TPA: toll/interleukin-1 receptor domain-containing protein [Allosphingosinicella sp.]|jgi:hypothetical protein